jgi:hypothetical protein
MCLQKSEFYPILIIFVFMNNYTTQSFFLLQLISFQFPDTFAAFLKQSNTQIYILRAFITQSIQQITHKRCLILLQILRSHILQQMSHTFKRSLSNLSFSICQCNLEWSLNMFEVSPCSLCNQKSANRDKGVLSNEVFVILEVFCEGFGNCDWIFAYDSSKLGTQIIDELTCFLN